MASGEENSEALECQTWVLKVSIHCEGCKRKVKKVLQSIDGVYTVNIDAQQHKVTVTGNVDADTLLKRLQKSGKNAELWPANKPNNSSSSSSSSSGGGSGSGKGHKKSGSKPKEPSENLENKPPSANENTATAAGNPTTAKPSEAAKLSNEAAENTGKEIKEEGGEHDTGRSSPPQEKQATTTPAATSEGGAIPATVTHGGSEGGKKKKKKKSKEQNNPSGATGSESDSEDKEAANTPAVGVGGHSPPRQPAYQVPVYHSQPVYSYSMTHPSVSYGNTYYAPAPPVSYSYVYGDHHQQDTYYVEEPASSSQSSYDLFSEENANACSIM